MHPEIVATCRIGRPDSIASRTPRSISSSGYFRPRGIAGGSPVPRTDRPRFGASAKPGLAHTERGGRPVQDFAAVCRAVLRGDATAAEDLRFVTFDVLTLDGEDLRGRPWTARNLPLADALPISGAVRRVEPLPASPAAHAAIVALGLEGTVLKRPSSTYRPGLQRVWLKHKARHMVDGVLLSVRQDRDGQWRGVCDVDGRRVSVRAGAGWVHRVGEVLTLAYSRVDADWDLREVRIAGVASTASVAG